MKKVIFIIFIVVSLLFLCTISPVGAVGIFRNSVGNWYLDFNNTGVIDDTFHFGGSGDIPVSGDWQGTGSDGIAIFRPSTGYWYFDYNLDGKVDKSFRYGGVGDQIITGDWQGTGSDGIAIFRPSTGYWYFDYNLDGKVDKSFRYGGVGDQIITGDWQGTGSDGIAIFRPSTGYWYFDYNLDGKVDKSFRYGGVGDQIITGDWQGTGSDGIAIFRPSTGYWYFDYNLDGKVDKSFRYGGVGDQIITGDWQGTGSDGIAIFRPSTGYWYFDYNLDGKVDKSFRYGDSTDQIVVGKWHSPVISAPIADFIVDTQSGNAPLTVHFTNQSSGTAPLTFAWDFTNDGVIDNTQANSVFTYSTPGTYTVNLTVTNAAGSNTIIKKDYITVNEPPSSQTGIALTFDDAYVDQWYAIRDILKKYNAHATFFVAYYYSLSPDQIDELKTLAADGNEIAYHGYSHQNEIEYLQNHTLDEYMNNEIINGLELMKNDGFNPVDFAYPYGYYDPNATQALQKYFIHMRATSYDWSDPAIYYQYDSNQPIIFGIGIDDITYNFTWDDYVNGMSKAKSDNKILILYGHQTVANVTTTYETSYDRVDKILQYASANNMKTFTISEIN